MNIVFSSLHLIDHLNDTILKKEISDYGDNLNEYVQELINEIVNSGNNRKFMFRSDSTEVRVAIDEIMNGDLQAACEKNVKRLLSVEKKTQIEIDQLKVKILRGSLFQVYINQPEVNVILCKADHSEILDEVDFTKRKGLSLGKKIFKAILIKFNETKEISEVLIYDTNNKISKYWWYDFLELEEKYTDEHNTKISLETLDRKIFAPIRENYPNDYIILRNATVGYYRNNIEFDYSTFYNSIFENYIPINETFPLDKIKSKVQELPDKWGFDKKFDIKKNEINKRLINSIPLTDQIDLVLRDHINNLNDLIQPHLDKEKNKWIKIRTDKGYEYFKK